MAGFLIVKLSTIDVCLLCHWCQWSEVSTSLSAFSFVALVLSMTWKHGNRLETAVTDLDNVHVPVVPIWRSSYTVLFSPVCKRFDFLQQACFLHFIPWYMRLLSDRVLIETEMSAAIRFLPNMAGSADSCSPLTTNHLSLAICQTRRRNASREMAATQRLAPSIVRRRSVKFCLRMHRGMRTLWAINVLQYLVTRRVLFQRGACSVNESSVVFQLSELFEIPVKPVSWGCLALVIATVCVYARHQRSAAMFVCRSRPVFDFLVSVPLGSEPKLHPLKHVARLIDAAPSCCNFTTPSWPHMHFQQRAWA